LPIKGKGYLLRTTPPKFQIITPQDQSNISKYSN